MELSWIRRADGRWCSLEHLDLSRIKTTAGVYVIWHAGMPSRVVRVGQGNIVSRLAVHRADPEIMQYGVKGRLLVTWAAVARDADRDGIVRFLLDRYRPLTGGANPVVIPIRVNLPGAA